MSESKLAANVGEWSELYAFLKILTDKKLYSSNSSLDLLYEDSLDVIYAEKISRISKKEIYYFTNHGKDYISIALNPQNDPIKNVEIDKVKLIAEEMLRILNSKPTDKLGAFKIDSISNFLKDEFGDPKISAVSSSKDDIKVLVKYLKPFPTEKKVGFSIKSLMGGDPTIFNASGSTNVVYKIENFDQLSQENIDFINNLFLDKKKSSGDYKADVSGRVRYLYSKGCKLIYSHTQRSTLQTNLEMIDSKLPLIYSELLIEHFLNKNKKPLFEMVQDLSIKNPCNFLSEEHRLTYYEQNVKKLLAAMWRGMTAGKSWTKTSVISGGFIFVKVSGELACFHIFNWDLFEDYLYKCARIDTPSASRHKFGEILKDGYFVLNGSIRHQY
jgi:hypothetical protein